jgi:hypothetical protein
MPLDREQLDALVGGIDSLGGEVQELRGEVAADRVSREAENKERRVHNLRTRALIFVAGGLGVFGLLVGAWGLNRSEVANQAVKDAKTALEQSKAKTDEARKAVCDSDNKFIVAHDNLVYEDIRTLQEIFDSPTSSDAARAFLQLRIDAYQANVLPVRDCSSKAAIDAFYENGG